MLIRGAATSSSFVASRRPVNIFTKLANWIRLRRSSDVKFNNTPPFDSTSSHVSRSASSIASRSAAVIRDEESDTTSLLDTYHSSDTTTVSYGDMLSHWLSFTLDSTQRRSDTSIV